MKTIETLRKEILELRRGDNGKPVPWRDVAAHYPISHGTVARIAEGHVPSKETCQLLGVRKGNRVRVCVQCGYGEEGRQRKREIEAWLKANGYKTLTDAVMERMRSNE